MNATDNLPERIQMLVDALGSQRALARLVDVSDGTVIGWLEGATPYAKTLQKIAVRTGVSLQWLREGKGDETVQLEKLRAQSKQKASASSKTAEEAPVYGAPEASQIIHETIDYIAQHGSVDDVRMLEDILLAARRRIQDRRRGAQ